MLFHGGAEDGVDGLHDLEVVTNCRFGDLGFSGEDRPHIRLGLRSGISFADLFINTLFQPVAFGGQLDLAGQQCEVAGLHLILALIGRRQGRGTGEVRD